MTSENLSKNQLRDKICILGSGYIGTALHHYLSTSARFEVELIGSNHINYHDSVEFSKYLLNHNINYVVNCSGFTGRPNVDEAESRKPECWELNVLSPLRINSLCNRLGVRYIHISSGCIYDGYLKDYTEKDVPDFGLFDYSSFYSKSKHAFELGSTHLHNKIVRVRMPICNDLDNPRNYLNKIMKYPNLVNYTNSKTYIPDLCNFIEALITKCLDWMGQDIYNVVNSEPFDTQHVVHKLNYMNEGEWKRLDPNWVCVDELNMTAPRSNCVLDNTKASKIFKLHTEDEILNMVCNYNNGIQGV